MTNFKLEIMKYKNNALISTIKFFLVMVFCSVFGFAIGYYFRLNQTTERAIQVLNSDRDCYDVQDIEIIIFGEIQL